METPVIYYVNLYLFISIYNHRFAEKAADRLSELQQERAKILESE